MFFAHKGDNMKLYVGNLNHTMTNADLEALFSSHGAVASARIISDHFTRQSKCFGYVEMLEIKDGQEAIETLDGKKLSDRRLIVKEARPRDERQGCGW